MKKHIGSSFESFLEEKGINGLGVLPEAPARTILRRMQCSPWSCILAPVLAGVLSIASLGCLSSSNPTGSGSSTNVDGGALGSDSGAAGCSVQILSRCAYASGLCFEYSGSSTVDAGDPFGCVQSGGTLDDDGQGCDRTGTEGSCVTGAGIGIVNGKPCDFTLTWWLPGGYDSGVPGENCQGNGVSGTFTAN